MRLLRLHHVAVGVAVASGAAVFAHQFDWRTVSSCPGCESCPSHCSAGTCYWNVGDNWQVTTCEVPPYCDICDYTLFPDDSGDDATIANVGTKTIGIRTFTLDVLTIEAESSPCEVTLVAVEAANTLNVDALVLDAINADIELKVEDGAAVISY